MDETLCSGDHQSLSSLRALGLLLEDGAPTVQWGGARLFAALEGHPHGNDRNSETKILKIEAIAEGYKRAIDEIRGPIAKNGFSGQNPKILTKKKSTS